VPELPDVEHHRRTVAEHATGQRVERVAINDPALLEGTSPQGLGRSLVGRTVTAPRRHGKWLILEFDGEDGPHLLVHFRMTGRLVWHEDGEVAGDDAVALHLEHGVLAYRSERRLGAVWYLPPGTEREEVTGPLGPDAVTLDRNGLAEVLGDRRGGLKSALLDQARIAGLGNELVDEVLWRSRLHPRRRAASLEPDELDALHQQLRIVLRRAIRAGHVPAGPTWLNGQRAEREPRCPDCGGPLVRERIAGRTTLWCPTEQPPPGVGG